MKHLKGIADAVTTAVVSPGDSFARGTQAFGPHSSCAVAATSAKTLQQLRECRIPCTKDNKPHVRGSVACPQAVWGDCEIGCMQRRKGNIERLAANNDGKNESVCEIKSEERVCRAKMCAFDPYSDCAYIVRMTVPNFDMRLWSTAWKEELIEALASSMQVIDTCSILIYSYYLILLLLCGIDGIGCCVAGACRCD